MSDPAVFLIPLAFDQGGQLILAQSIPGAIVFATLGIPPVVETTLSQTWKIVYINWSRTSTFLMSRHGKTSESKNSPPAN
jgi:hypothetical protein